MGPNMDIPGTHRETDWCWGSAVCSQLPQTPVPRKPVKQAETDTPPTDLTQFRCGHLATAHQVLDQVIQVRGSHVHTHRALRQLSQQLIQLQTKGWGGRGGRE